MKGDEMILTLQKRGTITVSNDLRKRLGITPGDPLLVTIENGRLVLTPVSVVPRTLELTPKGEKKIREAEEDLKSGRVKQFNTAEELIRDLEE